MSYEDYPKLFVEHYTIKELKKTMKHFSFKTPQKRKHEMIRDLHHYLRRYVFSRKIQRAWRQYIVRQFNRTQGPAVFNRSICNNTEDFLTMETMQEIEYIFFISYRDKNNFVYGFHILSIGTLIEKKGAKNPYTMEVFPDDFIQSIQKRKIYNQRFKHVYKEQKPILQTIEAKLAGIFQKLDYLGNYTQVEWVTKLTNKQLKKFIYTLWDMWMYRIGLTSSERIDLCPPFGDPFRGISGLHVVHNTQIFIENRTLKHYIFSICDAMINNPSTDIEKQSLCALYILTSLTLVSKSAELAMPSLYESIR